MTARWQNNAAALLFEVALILGVAIPGAAPLGAEPRAGGAVEVDEARLWLPKSLNEWRFRLQAAARAAAADPRCLELLEGTWDESHSSAKRPVFRFVCRDEAGQTFSVRYDSKELKPLSTQGLAEALITPEQKALHQSRAAAERARQRAAQADSIGADCERLLAARTATFRGVAPIRLAREPDQLVFRGQFSAQDPNGRTLFFTAECRPGPGLEPTLKLAPAAQPR